MEKSENTNNTLNIENVTINTIKSVQLLGVTTNKKLNFEKHVSVLCKASLLLNTTTRFQKHKDRK